MKHMEVPTQKKMIDSISSIPIEYFKWGTHPDHFKIDMPHRHEFSEILFFTKGGGVHEIGFHDFEVTASSIHYIPKSVVHFLKREKNSDGFTISFDDKYLEKNDHHRLMNPLKHEPFVLNLCASKFQEIISHSKILLSQIKKQDQYYRNKGFLLSIQLLLNEIASERSKVLAISDSQKEISLLNDFKYLVKTNIHKHHSLSWYAKELHLTPNYISEYVKKEIGVSAKKYIVQSLLSSVKQALIDSNKTVFAIALDHNYNPSALGKLFKKHVGYTMNRYRSAPNS
jgi:AraC family transcriptional regulator, transcriptional activator of pobA